MSNDANAGERAAGHLSAKPDADLRPADAGLGGAASALANALDRVTDGIVALDREWRYTYVNRSAGQVDRMRSTREPGAQARRGLRFAVSIRLARGAGLSDSVAYNGGQRADGQRHGTHRDQHQDNAADNRRHGECMQCRNDGLCRFPRCAFGRAGFHVNVPRLQDTGRAALMAMQ